MDPTIIVPIAAFVIVALVVRRSAQWHDPSLSSKEKQAEARMWTSGEGR